MTATTAAATDRFPEAAGLNVPPRQMEVYAFVVQHVEAHGCPPTLEEIAGHFGFGRTNAWQMIRRLGGRGLLRVGDGSRTITLARRSVFDAAPAQYPELDGVRVSAKAAAVYRRLVEGVRRNGYQPTLDEIADHLGYSFASGAQKAVAALVAKGLIVPCRRGSRRVGLPHRRFFTVPVEAAGAGAGAGGDEA